MFFSKVDRIDRDRAKVNEILRDPNKGERYKNDLESFYRKKEAGASFMDYDTEEIHAAIGFDIETAKIDDRFIP